MKKKLMMLLVLMNIFMAYGQSYDPLVNPLRQWSRLRCYSGNTPPEGCITFFNKFYGDTLIENQQYTKVWETDDTLLMNWELKGFMREDMQSKQVFFRSFYPAEGLLYDFDLQLNDTITVTNTYFHQNGSYPVTFICYKIDSTFLNGSYHKKFTLKYLDSGYYEFYETWIEGIGSEAGVVASGWSYCIGAFYISLCCEQEGEQLYSTPFNFCHFYGSNLGPQITTTQLDTAYRNTPYSFQVQITPHTFDSVLFLSDWMPWDFTIDPVTGIITGTPPNNATNDFFKIMLKNWKLWTDGEWFDLIVVNPVAITTTEPENDFKVIPDQTGENICFTLGDNLLKQQGLIECYDLFGRLMEKIPIDNGQNKAEIKITTWPAGIYLAVIFSNGGAVGRTKFVVE